MSQDLSYYPSRSTDHRQAYPRLADNRSDQPAPVENRTDHGHSRTAVRTSRDRQRAGGSLRPPEGPRPMPAAPPTSPTGTPICSPRSAPGDAAA